MPIKNKHNFKSIINPSDIYGKKKSDFNNIQTAFIFFKKSYMNYLKDYGFKNFNFYDYNCLLSNDNKFIGLSGFGMGSPAIAILLEQLRYFGIKRFILIGTAGGIGDNLISGDILICKKSFIDEGTSPNYVNKKITYSSNILNKEIENIFKKDKIDFDYAFSWTTDAVFRETSEEIKLYSEKKINTVDMESSAAFSVKDFYKEDILVSCIFVISDIFIDGIWNGFGDNKKIKNGIKKVLNSLVQRI